MIPSGSRDEFLVAQACEKVVRLVLAGANPNRLQLPSKKQWLSAISYWGNSANLEMLGALLPPPDANPLLDRRVALAGHVAPEALAKAQEAFDMRANAPPHLFFHALMDEVGGEIHSNGRSAGMVRRENLVKTVERFSSAKTIREKLEIVALCGSAQYIEALKKMARMRGGHPKVREAAKQFLSSIPDGSCRRIRR